MEFLIICKINLEQNFLTWLLLHFARIKIISCHSLIRKPEGKDNFNLYPDWIRCLGVEYCTLYTVAFSW